MPNALENALSGQTCAVIRREFDWCFTFGQDCGVAVSSPWRLTRAEGVLWSDRDDRQMFGLPAPFDAEHETNRILLGARVELVEIAPGTSDLLIAFSNGVRLEVWNASCGYEAWLADYPGGTTVAQGGGRLSLFQSAPS